MEVEYTISDLQKRLEVWHKMGLSIGFVPTEGNLDQSSEAVIKQAKSENDKVVLSITAPHPNPGFESDCSFCANLGIDIIFSPGNDQLYPQPFFTSLEVANSGLNKFCLLLLKLFNIVRPTNAYFGHSDSDKITTIESMVNDLNQGVNIIFGE